MAYICWFGRPVSIAITKTSIVLILKLFGRVGAALESGWLRAIMFSCLNIAFQWVWPHLN